MRQQAETLEHHADLAPAELAQRLRAVAQDVVAIHQDLAAAGLHQAVDVAHQGGLAGAGKAHDDEAFAGTYGKGQVMHTHHATGGLQHFGLAKAFPQQHQRFFGTRPEDLADTPQDDLVRLLAAHDSATRSGRP
ncbi:hypothetical protein D9M70_566250 [compost metagenome]